MSRKHIAIIVESAHGHIHPTMGIASCLISHGYRVSYATGQYFEPRLAAIGAEVFVYEPLDYRKVFAPRVKNRINDVRFMKACWKDFQEQEIEQTLSEIEPLYSKDRPDLIIYDCRNLAGRELALKLGITKIEHSPIMIGGDDKYLLEHTYDDNLVITSIPICFQRNPEILDKRFYFIDPIFTQRNSLAPHQPEKHRRRTILVSQSTAGVPSTDFFELTIAAFAGSEFKVILSIGESLDPDTLSSLPSNIEINRSTPHLDILEHASLLIGHAGQGNILEALYCGVPVLVVPSALPLFERIALRIVELGFGTSIPRSDLSAENLRESARSLLENHELLNRVRQMKHSMRNSNNREQVMQLITERLTTT